MLVLQKAALCLHHVVYREIRKSEQTQPKGLSDEEQALKRWSVVKVSWGWGICMLGITSPQLQCHPGTLTGHGRAHPSQGRFSSSTAGQSPRQVKAQQSISCSVLVEAGVDQWISGAGRAFPSRSPVLSLLSDTSSSSYHFPTPQCCNHPPLMAARALGSSMDTPMPTIPHSPAQVPAGHTILGEASKDLSPTAAQQGHQASLLPPHRSFIITISERKQNGHQEMYYGLDLSKFVGMEIELWT